MYIRKLLKLVITIVMLNGFLFANDLNELRAILGDESAINKKNDTEVKNQTNIDNESEKEEISSTSDISYNSLLDAPSDYYTINITTTDGIEAAKNYLLINNFDNSGIYIYKFGPEMRSVKIIYGIFKSTNEAKKAMEKLPNSIIKNKPYVDNINKHQKLYLKYN